jgi:hypothetical protein
MNDGLRAGRVSFRCLVTAVYALSGRGTESLLYQVELSVPIVRNTAKIHGTAEDAAVGVARPRGRFYRIVKAIIRQALVEPQLLLDLKGC